MENLFFFFFFLEKPVWKQVIICIIQFYDSTGTEMTNFTINP